MIYNGNAINNNKIIVFSYNSLNLSLNIRIFKDDFCLPIKQYKTTMENSKDIKESIKEEISKIIGNVSDFKFTFNF